jgi:hypothetical protein
MERSLRRDLVGDTAGREGGGMGSLRLAAKATMLSVANLIVLGVAIIGAVASQDASALWLAPAGSMAVLSWKLLGARLGGSAAYGRALVLPDSTSLSDLAAQSMVRRIAQARRSLTRVVAAAPPGGVNDLSEGLRGVRELERRALVLIARVEYLGQFLATVSDSQLGAEWERLRARERKALSPAAKAIYQAASERYAGHAEHLRLIEARRDQVLAALDYMVSTLEALPSMVMRVHLVRVETCAGDLGEPIDDATRVFDDLTSLEETLAPIACAEIEAADGGGSAGPPHGLLRQA